jgi:hypothetical protein
MTHWGYLLLAAFVALGLAPISRRRAAHLSLVLILLVMVYEFHSYGGLH